MYMSWDPILQVGKLFRPGTNWLHLVFLMWSPPPGVRVANIADVKKSKDQWVPTTKIPTGCERSMSESSEFLRIFHNFSLGVQLTKQSG